MSRINRAELGLWWPLDDTYCVASQNRPAYFVAVFCNPKCPAPVDANTVALTDQKDLP